jgi:hypothetical protein
MALLPFAFERIAIQARDKPMRQASVIQGSLVRAPWSPDPASARDREAKPAPAEAASWSN